MRDRIAISVFWIVWSRGGLQLVSFVSTLIVARTLNPSDYGLIALAGIWTGTISLIAEMGLGSAIVQFRDLDNGELNACFWLTMTVASIGYLGLYMAAPAIAAWFSAPMLSDILRVVGLTLPLTAVRIVPDAFLRKHLALDKVSQAEIAAGVATMPVVVGLAWAGTGVWALVAGALTWALVQSAATFWFMPWWPGLRIGGRQLKKVLSYSLATLGAKICWAIYQQADTFVLGKVSGEVITGFYSMAKQLASLPVTKVTVIVNQLGTPLMAELQTNSEALCASFMKSLRLVTSVSLPLSIGLMLAAEDLIRVALTEKWIAVVPIVQILCFYFISYSIGVLSAPVLMALYRADLMLRYTLLQLLVMPIAFWTGTIWWNAIGGALAWALIYPITLVWSIDHTLCALNTTWRTFLSQFRHATFATILMTGAVLMVRWVLGDWRADFAVVRLAGITFIGAAAYAAGLMWLGGPLYGELREVAGWVFRGGRVGVTIK